jgi:tetratricopeptide (TPR) repeat protein
MKGSMGTVMNRLSLTCLGGVLCSGLLQPLPAGAQAGSDPYGGQLGTVQWPTSCASAVQPQLERGLALLHHMTYRGARTTFEAVAVQDPDCAMAYWGQSMTHIHPLWSDPPSEESFQQGLRMAEKAAQQPGLTDRERAMVAAVQRYWAVGRSSDERPNLEAFAEGWNQALQKYPGDSEIRSFAALAVLSTADPGDKSYRIQRQASAIAALVLKQVPNHPGANHYTIHAHDLPTLADQALGVARDYGRIAPSVPHALHMPSHIFTRLGLWEESVEMNSRSARAALQHPAGEAISLHYLHALDYLVYAYLQQGNPDAAAEVAAVMEGLEDPLQTHLASGYTLAAVPARIALEQQRWESAADVAVGSPERFPWQKFPAMEAISRFSRSLGAARSGQTARAEAELRRLEQLEVAARETSAYWGKQVAIMRQSALAWLLFSQGDQEAALVAMRAAAALEATTEKHAVTPGEVLPAQELLGDMLIELDKPAEAYQAYAAVLERSPGRLNSLYGAGKAAEAQGDMALARTHYGELVTMVGSTARSPRIDHARAALRGR